jgi:hypothetical protein
MRALKRDVKKVGLTIILGLMLAMVWSAAALAGPGFYNMPPKADKSEKYLFFLHNYYVEVKGPDQACDYHGIVKAFANQGYLVVSEVREKNISSSKYAAKVAGQIKTLLAAGVPARHITVLGHSKGGYITLVVSALIKNPDINYVIMAGCGIKGPCCGAAPSAPAGRMLSIFDQSDKVAGSCKAEFAKGGKNVRGSEVVLKTGGGHRMFFTVKPSWFDPVMAWLKEGK